MAILDDIDKKATNAVFQDAWKGLKFSASSPVLEMAGALGWTLKKREPDNMGLTYRSARAYKSVLVFNAKRKLMQETMAAPGRMYAAYKKYLADKERDAVMEKQQEEWKTLIENRRVVSRRYGEVEASNSNGHSYVARDIHGYKVDTALMMYYDMDPEEVITVTDISFVLENNYYDAPDLNKEERLNIQTGGLVGTRTFTTNTLCHIDLLAQVTSSSSKNLVQTKVQGRDFTRKELISGGDIVFNISGKLVGKMGEYPSDAVKKLIQLSQYKGVVKVNNFIFDQYNVREVIITSMNLGQIENYNEQPYTMECVAVEPDDAVKLSKDTIGQLNTYLERNLTDGWQKVVRESKLEQITANAATSILSNGLGQLIDLIPTI